MSVLLLVARYGDDGCMWPVHQIPTTRRDRPGQRLNVDHSSSAGILRLPLRRPGEEEVGEEEVGEEEEEVGDEEVGEEEEDEW